MKKIFLILFLLSLSASAGDWFKIEGRYAVVEYTRQNQVIADSLLKIAELDIPRLCKMADLPVKSFTKHRARIILTDAPDLSNGFAVDDAIVIYALSSMYLSTFTGTDSWYKMVLSHELVHQTLFRKTRRKLSHLGFIFDLSVPRWFHEGMAQYFSEEWTAFRGDIYLQEALLGGRLTFNNMESLADGRLLYSAGHAFVRYLATTYGDSSLIKLLSYDKKGFYYDFDKAFKAVYKKDPKALFPEFIRHMVIHYGDKLAAYPVTNIFSPLPETGYTTYQMFPLNTMDSVYVALLKLDQAHLYNTAVVLQFKDGKSRIEKTITNHIDTPLILSTDRKFIAYGRYELGQENNQLSVKYRWYVYDISSSTEHLITHNIRARYGLFDLENNLILAEVSASGTMLKKFNQEGVFAGTILKTEMPLGRMNLLADGRMLFEAQRKNGRRDLFLLDKGKISDLTDDAADDRNPIAINDSLLVFNRIDNLNFTLAVYNFRKNCFKTKVNAQRAYRLSDYDKQNKRLICSYWEAGRKNKFVALPLDSLLQSEIRPDLKSVKMQYAHWQLKTPQPVNLRQLPDTSLQISQRKRKRFPQFPLRNVLTFALPTYDYQQGWGIYGTAIWLEALQRQVLEATFVGFADDFNKSLLLLGHLIKINNFQLSNSFYHGPAVFSYNGDRYLNVVEDIYALGMQRTLFLNGNSRLRLTPQLGYLYSGYRFLHKEPNYPEKSAFHGLNLSLSFQSSLPTKNYPAVAQRHVEASASYFRSFTQKYDFEIRQVNLKLAKSFFWEEFGLSAEMSWMQSAGKTPPLKRLGIDRFYQLNIPRDILESKTVRGVNEDIWGDRLLWASLNAAYLIKKSTSWKLLFLPINNLTVNAFYDIARVRQEKEVEVSGYGAELGFGDQFLRWSLGYALGKGTASEENRRVYGRISLYLPGM